MAYPADEGTNVHRTRDTVDFFPALERHEGWNASYPETRSKSLLRFSIDFAQLHGRLKLGGGAFEHGRHHTAWPTPRRPKIDNQR